jgi:hypothetical protein
MVTTDGAKLVLTSVTVAATGPDESEDPEADWTGMFWAAEQAVVPTRASVAPISASR